MASRFYPAGWLVVLFGSLLGVLAPTGCKSPPMAANVATRSHTQVERLRRDLTEYRETAWRTAAQVIAAYEHVSAEQVGIVGLVRDFRSVQRSVEADGRLDLSRLDTRRLMTENPNFWRANLEVAPSDASFLLLHAALLAAGGEIWKAHRVLTAATQLLPMDTQVRALCLAHSYGLAALTLQVRDLTQSHLDGAPLGRMVDAIRRGLEEFPSNPLLLLSQLEQAEAARPREGGRAETDPLVQRLALLDPVAAAPFRGTAEQRKHGQTLRELWGRMAAKDAVLDYRAVAEIVQALEGAAIPELALIVQRLLITTRGFASPGDALGYRRMLPSLVGEAAAVEILRALDEGDINVVELTGSRDSTTWRGDPLANPLVAQQIDREIADCSFQISLLRDNPTAQAIAYRRRGVQQSRAGLHDEALADFDAALRLGGSQPALLADKAAILGSIQRDTEAETIFQELERSKAGREAARHSLGLFRFGQGRFAEAKAILEEEVRLGRPGNAYAAILADLAARRLGQDARPALERVRRTTADEAWVAWCIDFLLNRRTEEQLLQKVHEGGTVEFAQKTCEASFILSHVYFARGNADRAMNWLESCIQSGMTGFAEFSLARLELKRLAPEREARFWLFEPGATPAVRGPGRPSPREKPAVEAGGKRAPS